VSSLFVFTLCLSGAVLLFREPLDALVTPARVVVPAAVAKGFDALARDVERHYPGAVVTGFEIPQLRERVYAAYVSQGPRFFVAFTDPYTGRVTGERVGDGLANGTRRVHVNFYWLTRVWVGAAGVVLLLSALTGLLIYWPFARGLGRWWQIRKGLQFSVSDWHKLLGLMSSVFLLLLSVTGALMGFARYIGPLQRAPKAVRGSGAAAISGDEAMAIALRRISMRPTSLLLPGPGAPRYTIYGTVEQAFAADASSFVVVHSATGEVVDAHDIREASLAVLLFSAMERLHYGAFGGAAVKILYFVFGLTAALLPVSGSLLWWLKK